MFRIGVKFPYHGLPRISRHNPPTLYFVPRNYAERHAEPTKSKGGTGFKYTVGTLTVATVATFAYAAYDKDFRRWLGNNVPYSDDFLKIVLQEEGTFLEQLQSVYENVKSSIYTSLFGKTEETKEGKVPVKIEITEEAPKKEYKLAQIDKPAPEEKELKKLPETHPKNLADLESKISTLAIATVAAYGDATNAIKDYSKNIYAIIDSSVQNLDPDVWEKLKKLIERKDEAVVKAEKNAKEALQNIEKMKNILKGGLDNVSGEILEKANRNVERIMTAVTEAKEELDEARRNARVTEQYWDKVEQARKFFEQELQLLFPGIKLSEKQLRIDEGELDLFLLHAVSTVLYYQKELKKLETITDARIRKALDKVGPGSEAEVILAKITAELEKERRALESEFQKKVLQLRIESESDVRQQLKIQAQAHTDHLADAVAIKQKELERHFQRIHNERLEEEHAAYKMQLAAMLGRLRGMDDALKARAENDKHARKAQVLWSACQSLHRSLKTSTPGVPWQKQLRPLKGEIENVTKAASEEDELVKVVLDGIPPEAVGRGVYTEEAMRERFLKVERVARRLALLPEKGGSLPLYLLSFLQSFLVIKAINPIPSSELADEPVDLSKLDTYDILQRARYWLDRGDFSMALRYMNLLKGAARCIAKDWMNETRILLETQQAANTLMAHAAASGMMYV
ncbi:MICOS complex subunit Mic60 [Periplaneta americana]|uniref:MICOS complex subunit Mic60 n=1 Tax=Periplaneta americana TaxID=6978 RepID=UPI0037E8C32C